MTIVKTFDFTLSGSAYGSAIYTNGFPISEIVAPTSASAATALTVQTSLDGSTFSQLLSNGLPYTIPIIAGSASKIPESAFNGIPYLKFAANANVGTSIFSMSYYNNYPNDEASISHANLNDLQGGGINELYHLSLSQYNNLSGSVAVSITGISNELRLTLTSGSPYNPTYQSNKQTIYLTPAIGNRIGLYSGSAWNNYATSEISISSASAVANLLYDIFAYYTGAAVALETIPYTNTTGSIVAATNATPIVLTVGAGHGLVTGNHVVVSSAGGNTSANGIWAVTVSGSSVTLLGSIGNGTYTGSGIWQQWDQSRSTSVVRQDGILVKNGSPTSRYLGRFRATSSGSTGDAYLENQYNNYMDSRNVPLSARYYRATNLSLGSGETPVTWDGVSSGMYGNFLQSDGAWSVVPIDGLYALAVALYTPATIVNPYIIINGNTGIYGYANNYTSLSTTVYLKSGDKFMVGAAGNSKTIASSPETNLTIYRIPQQ